MLCLRDPQVDLSSIGSIGQSFHGPTEGALVCLRNSLAPHSCHASCGLPEPLEPGGGSARRLQGEERCGRCGCDRGPKQRPVLLYSVINSSVHPSGPGVNLPERSFQGSALGGAPC